MGASLVYLDKPNKNIDFEFGSNDLLEFVAAGMQGWRLNMEDSHVAELSMDSNGDKNSLFGVFDGHGGREVAIYVKRHLKRILTQN